MTQMQTDKPFALVPVPDPTVLTTVQLNREISALKETIFARLDAMDKALDLFHNNITRVPTDTDKQVSHLRELHNERFSGIAVQFLERDARVDQTAKDSKIAVDAALQAAKEAVGEQNKSSALAIAKSEAATTKQIDSMGVLIQSNTVALNDKIEDIKGRLTLIEGKGLGQSSSQYEGKQMNSFLLAVVMAVIAAASLAVAFTRL